MRHLAYIKTAALLSLLAACAPSEPEPLGLVNGYYAPAGECNDWYKFEGDKIIGTNLDPDLGPYLMWGDHGYAGYEYSCTITNVQNNGPTRSLENFPGLSNDIIGLDELKVTTRCGYIHSETSSERSIWIKDAKHYSIFFANKNDPSQSSGGSFEYCGTSDDFG